jgi:Domain of unknown function (DUF5666)
MSKPIFWRKALGTLLAAALLWSCGGGTNVATVGTGGTGSFSVGVVTGFGSVIVNGQVFDDSSASVRDADGQRSKDDLQLGMVVKVEGRTDSTGSGTATSIEFDSELLGPVSNLSGNSFNILGQKVITHTGTVYAPSLTSGLASIRDGQILEVHGFVLPQSNEIQATLVALKTSPNVFKISGLVADLVPGTSFKIGTLSISYAGLTGSDAPGSLSNGTPVKVRLVTTPPAAGQPWPATRVRINKDALADKDEAEIEGVITALTSTASFSIGNVVVDASQAVFRDGSAGVLLGARVEAKGSLVGGVLVAKEIKLEDDGNEVELNGTISGLNTTDKTFVVRGQTLRYSASTQFKNGAEADLADNRRVEVKAQLQSGTAALQALEIKF